MRRSFSRDPDVERSLDHSIKDGIAFAFMSGVGESFFSAFAVFLRATTPQVGLLASVPLLVASFSQLLSVWLAQRTYRRRPIIVAGALIQACALILMILLPLIVPNIAILAVLVSAVIYFIGPNIGAPLWGSLMGDLVPESRRGRFFARRTKLSSIAGFASLLIGGSVLHYFSEMTHTYLGFAVIFSLAFIARIVSAYHLNKLIDPTHDTVNIKAPWHTDLWRRLRESQFAHFSLFFACMQFAVAISGPYIVVHMLRNLEFSYLQLTFNTAASVLVQFLTLNRWGRLSDLFGNRLILLTTGFTIPFIPSLWIVSSDYLYLLLVQALSGLVWSGFTLSATNYVYDLTPRHRRATYMAFHNVFAATAIFMGAATGGCLALALPTSFELQWISLSWEHGLFGVFAVATVVRLMVALVFLTRLEEVRAVRSMSVPGLIFRVTRFHPVSGLTFDVVGRVRRRATRDKFINGSRSSTESELPD